jgi:hypothetical protein
MKLKKTTSHISLSLNGHFSRQAWEGKNIIQGKCEKDTWNENISMAIYTLVHKLQQTKSKKKSKLWNRG